MNIGAPDARDAQSAKRDDDLTTAERRAGTANSLYGNRVVGFPEGAFAFTLADAGQTPEQQTAFSGNDIGGGPTEGDPDKACPESVPTGDGNGHTGGESPWV